MSIAKTIAGFIILCSVGGWTVWAKDNGAVRCRLRVSQVESALKSTISESNGFWEASANGQGDTFIELASLKLSDAFLVIFARGDALSCDLQPSSLEASQLRQAADDLTKSIVADLLPHMATPEQASIALGITPKSPKGPAGAHSYVRVSVLMSAVRKICSYDVVLTGSNIRFFTPER